MIEISGCKETQNSTINNFIFRQDSIPEKERTGFIFTNTKDFFFFIYLFHEPMYAYLLARPFVPLITLNNARKQRFIYV